jgi:hypothetical protein
MKWTVIWRPASESGLTDLWVSAADKAAITAAANRIDVLLRRSPFDVGESRDDDDRVYFDAPLGILFTIDELDRKVFVERVWRIST